MLKDLHSLPGIPADSKVIDKKQLNLCIILNSLPVTVQVILPTVHDKFVQQVTVVNELAPVPNRISTYKSQHTLFLSIIRHSIRSSSTIFTARYIDDFKKFLTKTSI